MAVKIGKYVVAGQLRNSRKNTVFGWIEFAQDYGVRIELTGNLEGALAGQNIRFEIPVSARAGLPEPGEFPDYVEELANRQIGVVGKFACHSEETLGKGLYLQWYSQNGTVIADMPDLQFELFTDDADLDAAIDTDVAEFELGGEAADPHLMDDEDEEEVVEDPYGLFDEDLDQQVAQSLGSGEDDQSPSLPDEKLPWNEVIPGIDPETKAMYEQWDEIFEGKKDEPLSYLFETPLRLPKPESVPSDAEAEPLVTAILAQLALLSVALDVCEHFTPLETYHLLINEILPNAKVHPNLAATEMVQHYGTSDYCSICEEEFEREANDIESPDPDEP